MIRNAEIVEIQADPAAYHQQDAERGCGTFVMSRSDLMTFWDNPWKWLHGAQQGETESTAWGTLIDTLVLDRESFGKRYAVSPKEYPHEAKKGVTVNKPWNRAANYCKEWEATVAPRTVLKPHEEDEALRAVEVLIQHEEAAGLLAKSKRQVLCRAEWFDKDTKMVVPLKALIDIVPDVNHPQHGKRLVDFKTSVSANPNRWPYTCNRYFYDVQAAFYADIYNQATGEDRTDWVHLVQENTPPYCVELIGLDMETIEAGRATYQMALAEYCQCLKTNEWRSYYVDRSNCTVVVNGVPIMKCIPQIQARATSRMTLFHEPKQEEPLADGRH